MGARRAASRTGVMRLPGVLSADAPQVLLLQEGANDLNGGGPTAHPEPHRWAEDA